MTIVANGSVLASHDNQQVAAAQASHVLPLDAKVADAGYEQLSTRWWQWANAFPGALAPYQDSDGSLCAVLQDGDVWFLAGTDGVAAPQRHCTIPMGKHIFLPIINMYQRSGRQVSDNSRQGHCTILRAGVALNNDQLSSAEVLIDGVRVANPSQYRVQTPNCFDPYGFAGGESGYLAASDGYWLLLSPLPAGRHTIRVGANYGSQDSDGFGQMIQNFEYVLDIGGPTI